jgi:hypothetical protein
MASQKTKTFVMTPGHFALPKSGNIGKAFRWQVWLINKNLSFWDRG